MPPPTMMTSGMGPASLVARGAAAGVTADAVSQRREALPLVVGKDTGRRVEVAPVAGVGAEVAVRMAGRARGRLLVGAVVEREDRVVEGRVGPTGGVVARSAVRPE